MVIDHVALNAVSLEREIQFFVGFIGLQLLQQCSTTGSQYNRVRSFILHMQAERPDPVLF